jgi:hypothetical protein
MTKLDRSAIPPPPPSDLNWRGQKSSIFFAFVGVAVLLGIAAFVSAALPVSSQWVPLLIALALAPGAYLSFIIYGKDKYEPEPKKVDSIRLSARDLGGHSRRDFGNERPGGPGSHGGRD